MFRKTRLRKELAPLVLPFVTSLNAGFAVYP